MKKNNKNLRRSSQNDNNHHPPVKMEEDQVKIGVHGSVVEHGGAFSKVAGSIPVGLHFYRRMMIVNEI